MNHDEGGRRRAPPPPSKPPPPRGPPPAGKKKPPPPAAGRGGSNAGAQNRRRNAPEKGEGSRRNNNWEEEEGSDEHEPVRESRPKSSPTKQKSADRYRAEQGGAYEEEEAYSPPRRGAGRGQKPRKEDTYEEEEPEQGRRKGQARRQNSAERNRDRVSYPDDEEDYSDHDPRSNIHQKGRPPPSRDYDYEEPRSSGKVKKGSSARGPPRQRAPSDEDLVETLVQEVEEITITDDGPVSKSKRPAPAGRGQGGWDRGGPGQGRGRGRGRGQESQRTPSRRRDEDAEHFEDDDEEQKSPAWARNRGRVESDYNDGTYDDSYNSEEEYEQQRKAGSREQSRGGGARRDPPRNSAKPQQRPKSRDPDDYDDVPPDDDDEEEYRQGGQGRGRGRGRGAPSRGRGRGREQSRPKPSKNQRDEEGDFYEDEAEEDIREESSGRRLGFDLEEDRDRRALGGVPWQAGGGDMAGGVRRGTPMPQPVDFNTVLTPVLYDYRNIPHNLRELQDFVTNPPPTGPGTRVHCFIQRDNSGTKKLSPVYTLYADHEDGSGRLILSARKQLKSKTPYYVISTMREDLYRERTERSNHYLGKLRGNSQLTEYILYDSGENPNRALRETDSESEGEHGEFHTSRTFSRQGSTLGGADTRQELAVIHYVPEKKKEGLRRMEVGLPRLKFLCEEMGSDGMPIGMWRSESWRPLRELDQMAHKFARVRQEGGQNVTEANRLLVLHKKESRYDPLSSCLVDFRGRARQASVKNFQLIKSWPTDSDMQSKLVQEGESIPASDDEDTPRPVVLQMGKFGKDCYNMDFQFPLSMLQAFGICLSRFDTKLYY